MRQLVRWGKKTGASEADGTMIVDDTENYEPDMYWVTELRTSTGKR